MPEVPTRPLRRKCSSKPPGLDAPQSMPSSDSVFAVASGNPFMIVPSLKLEFSLVTNNEVSENDLYRLDGFDLSSELLSSGALEISDSVQCFGFGDNAAPNVEDLFTEESISLEDELGAILDGAKCSSPVASVTPDSPELMDIVSDVLSPIPLEAMDDDFAEVPSSLLPEPLILGDVDTETESSMECPSPVEESPVQEVPDCSSDILSERKSEIAMVALEPSRFIPPKIKALAIKEATAILKSEAKPRKRKATVPDEKKTAFYYDKRQRNNLSAAKNRANERKAREAKVLRYKEAVARNVILKSDVATLENALLAIRARKTLKAK